MALLVTSVFGVTGCGSDDDVQVESRVKNIAPEASGASDALSEAACQRDLRESDPRFDLTYVAAPVFDLIELRDLRDLFDLSDLSYLSNGLALRDLLGLSDLGDFSDSLERLIDLLDTLDSLLDQCAVASKSGVGDDDESDSGADAPKGDDCDVLFDSVELLDRLDRLDVWYRLDELRSDLGLDECDLTFGNWNGQDDDEEDDDSDDEEDEENEIREP
jgi:hypothetical protein